MSLILVFSLEAQARSDKNGLCDLLGEPVTVSISQYLDFPIVGSHEHSMAEALPTYVHQKIQTDLIKEAVSNGFSIEIVGSPPDILQCRLYGPAIFEEITVKYDKKTDKQENFRRPSYYYRVGKGKTLVIFVMPGEDYVKQIAALVGYIVKIDMRADPDAFVRVSVFPNFSDNIANWSHLDETFVKQDDVVLIGNVSDYYDWVKNEPFLTFIEENENFYYRSTRIKLGDKIVNFLRVKYSFWGNMSANLVSRMLDLGASEIIYMSKSAALDAPAHIYKKIYSPTRFVILENKKLEFVSPTRNSFVERFPELDSGAHLSMATVMEQDFITSRLAHSVAVSLDLETSKIARVIALHNQRHLKQVAFSPIQWATDYLRTMEEASIDTGFDLTNGNSENGKEAKKMILKRIYGFLTAYLASEKRVAISERSEMRAAIDFGSGALKIQMNLVDVAQNRILGEPLIAKITALDLTEDVAAHDGRISERMANKALNLLRAYKEEAQSQAAKPGLDSVRFVAVATAVFRKAHNGPDLLAQFERELGIQFKILSQHDEGVLGFATATALYSDVPEESLLVWDSGNGSFQFSAKQAGKYNLFLGPLGHGTVRVLLSKDMRSGPVLRSHEFGNPISKEESVELSQKITRLLPAIPEWLTDKIKSEETKVVTYGDGESIFALVAQAISVLDGDKAPVNQKSMSLSEVERVMDAFTAKGNKAFEDAGLHGKTLTSAIHLHTVMKYFGIDKIEYRRSIGNAPGMLTSAIP